MVSGFNIVFAEHVIPTMKNNNVSDRICNELFFFFIVAATFFNLSASNEAAVQLLQNIECIYSKLVEWISNDAISMPRELW